MPIASEVSLKPILIFRKLQSFMKHGKNKFYWNEYIIEGYVNYKSDMIFLAGFPDIPLSLPLSVESQKERGEL